MDSNLFQTVKEFLLLFPSSPPTGHCTFSVISMIQSKTDCHSSIVAGRQINSTKKSLSAVMKHCDPQTESREIETLNLIGFKF